MSSAPYTKGPYSVWVIDPDGDNARGIAAEIRMNARFECWATDVFDGLLGLPRTPHVIVSRERVAGVDVQDFIDRAYEHVPVGFILLSPIGDEESRLAAIDRVGPLRCVPSPPLAGELAPKLQALCERISLEREVRRLTDNLDKRDRALQASKSELATATERLLHAEQLAAVGRVMNGIAHELDRHLALVSYAEAIKARVADDPELCEFADIIVTAQKRLVSMVGEIRDFAHDTASTQWRREASDFAAVVEEAIAIMRFDANLRHRELCCHVDARPLASIHRQKFSQVVLNLLSNAVLATQPGAKIEVTVGTDAGFATLRVRDSGVGMSEDVIARLGEPFFTTRGDAGSGLGVGVCMRIVREHGGELTYESQVGVGTTAVVRVPQLETLGVTEAPS